MKEPIRRVMDEVGRARLPLKVLRRELGYEKQHNHDIGKGNVRGFRNFGVLFRALGACCALFHENQAIIRELSSNERTRLVGTSLRDTSQELAKVYNLLTDDPLQDKIPEIVADAYAILSDCCDRRIPNLVADLDNLV